MEGFEKRESREAVINKRIEELAAKEGVDPDDILSNIITFFEIYQEDPDVEEYFKEMSEKIGISFEEILEFAKKLKEE